MRLQWQFNDGLGWRGGATLESVTVAEVAEAAKEAHWSRWPNDHLRVMKEIAPQQYRMVWWQDGHAAEERMSDAGI
jgi:hypothetical protein